MKEGKFNREPLNEVILDDSSPVYWNCVYVANEHIICSEVQGTVFGLKTDLHNRDPKKFPDPKKIVIKTCDVAQRVNHLVIKWWTKLLATEKIEWKRKVLPSYEGVIGLDEIKLMYAEYKLTLNNK